MRKFFETSETFGIEKGKGSKKKPTRGKSFGYQILGFGSGGVAPKFVVATGGSVSTCGNFKVHQFTSSGTFEITCAGDARGSSSFDYMVIAGGGGAGGDAGGGGGAGGFRGSSGAASGCFTTGCTPRTGPVSAITASVASFPITVGAGGGPGGGNCGNGQSGGTGSNSVAFPITSNGGGGGGSHPSGGGATPGGNGGGQGRPNSPGPKSAAPGNNPPTSPPQGVPGSSVTGGGVTGNPGGTTSNITFSNVTRTTGGTRFQGGASGTGNTGNGGGGGNNTAGDAGGGGGSGIVIIRYKFK
jgi:hypothetical protein